MSLSDIATLHPLNAFFQPCQSRPTPMKFARPFSTRHPGWQALPGRIRPYRITKLQIPDRSSILESMEVRVINKVI
jgi:hypothetical protein